MPSQLSLWPTHGVQIRRLNERDPLLPISPELWMALDCIELFEMYHTEESLPDRTLCWTPTWAYLQVTDWISVLYLLRASYWHFRVSIFEHLLSSVSLEYGLLY